MDYRIDVLDINTFFPFFLHRIVSHFLILKNLNKRRFQRKLEHSNREWSYPKWAHWKHTSNCYGIWNSLHWWFNVQTISHISDCALPLPFPRL
jgi:hypothetical protein